MLSDLDALMDASTRKANRYYALSYPRDRWYVRGRTWWKNLRRRRAGDPFRFFVHPVARIRSLIAAAGFEVRCARSNLNWEVLVWERRPPHVVDLDVGMDSDIAAGRDPLPMGAVSDAPTRAEIAAAVNRTVPDLIAPDLSVLFCGINPGSILGGDRSPLCAAGEPILARAPRLRLHRPVAARAGRNGVCWSTVSGSPISCAGPLPRPPN